MNTPTIPDWCKSLPDSTIIHSADIWEFFGYTQKQVQQNITIYIRDGLLPPKCKRLEFKSRSGLKGTVVKKIHWLLGDIRKLRVKMIDEAKK